jgi:hypothetical protein
MVPSIGQEQARIAAAASSGSWANLNAVLMAGARNDLVSVDWDVVYDKIGHDIIIEARIKLIEVTDRLLQVWLKDHHEGMWIPEILPWVSSVVEFSPADNITTTHVALLDSKWRPEDAGAAYKALLWGYIQHKGAVEHFAFENDLIYPG